MIRPRKIIYKGEKINRMKTKFDLFIYLFIFFNEQYYDVRKRYVISNRSNGSYERAKFNN